MCMTLPGILHCSTHPQVWLPKSGCPSLVVQILLPFAGLLEAMMAGKFEWQFKYRDEADVNAPARRRRGDFKKSLICRHFCDSSDSVYRRILGHR
jgi:hypothetical protein